MSCCFDFICGSSNSSPPELVLANKPSALPNGNASPVPAHAAPGERNESTPVEKFDTHEKKTGLGRVRSSDYIVSVEASNEDEEVCANIIPTTPVTLEVMSGDWVSSHGAKVSFDGTDIIKMNTIPLKAHPVKTEESDGLHLVVSIGSLWQVKGWVGPDKLEFIEAPSRDRMAGARSVVFTRVNAKTLKAHQDHLNSLGYKGSASNPMNRGIEGCTPGSMDAKGSVKNALDDPSGMQRLGDLITKWRERSKEHLPRVCSRLVIPDCSNRGQTGLSVEHVHYVAASFKKNGFIPRGDDAGSIRETRRGATKGHDIPVLVRENPRSELGQRSIENWRRRVQNENGFPPISFYEGNAFKEPEFFTSLGNGHFNQALNLFSTESSSIYGDRSQYLVGADYKLGDAIKSGVPSIILRPDIPLRDREEIALGLNAKFDFQWEISQSGQIDLSNASESNQKYSQFEAMSKVLDAVELDCLVRSELGIKDSHRIGR